MPITLPTPVANYLTADKAKDPDLVVRCFADDALVHDENNDYRGIDAIKSWKQESMKKYTYTVEPLDVTVDNDTVKMKARVTGNFPNSPVELDYAFTLVNDKIAVLEIA